MKKHQSPQNTRKHSTKQQQNVDGEATRRAAKAKQAGKKSKINSEQQAREETEDGMCEVEGRKSSTRSRQCQA